MVTLTDGNMCEGVKVWSPVGAITTVVAMLTNFFCHYTLRFRSCSCCRKYKSSVYPCIYLRDLWSLLRNCRQRHNRFEVWIHAAFFSTRCSADSSLLFSLRTTKFWKDPPTSDFFFQIVLWSWFEMWFVGFVQCVEFWWGFQPEAVFSCIRTTSLKLFSTNCLTMVRHSFRRLLSQFSTSYFHPSLPPQLHWLDIYVREQSSLAKRTSCSTSESIFWDQWQMKASYRDCRNVPLTSLVYKSDLLAVGGRVLDVQME